MRTTTILSVSAEKAPHNQIDATTYSDEGTRISHHPATSGATRYKETSYKSGKEPDVELPDFRIMEE